MTVHALRFHVHEVWCVLHLEPSPFRTAWTACVLAVGVQGLVYVCVVGKGLWGTQQPATAFSAGCTSARCAPAQGCVSRAGSTGGAWCPA